MADATADQKTMIHVVSDDQGLVTLRVTASGNAAEAYLNPTEARAVADMLDRHFRLAERKAPTTTSFIGSSPGACARDQESAGRALPPPAAAGPPAAPPACSAPGGSGDPGRAPGESRGRE